jgi:hypothetical protein
MDNMPTKPALPKAKTAKEVLTQLGLPHTEVHLKIAQAGIDENAELRSTVLARISAAKSSFETFRAKIKALGGGADLAGVLARFIMQDRELKRMRPLRDETEYALLDAIEQIPAGPAKTNFLQTHVNAIRRARTPRAPAPTKTRSGPAL